MILAVATWDQSARLHAQSIEGIYSPDADRVFAQGLQAYRNGEYEEARTAFISLLEQVTHQHSSAGQLMLGKSYFRWVITKVRWRLRVVYRENTSTVAISLPLGC